jgi:hypothetical protein
LRLKSVPSAVIRGLISLVGVHGSGSGQNGTEQRETSMHVYSQYPIKASLVFTNI